MFAWFRRDVPCVGSVLFPGPLPPRPEELSGLEAGGVGVRRLELISDWRIMSPFGSITPAFGMALREVRERPDELRHPGGRRRPGRLRPSTGSALEA